MAESTGRGFEGGSDVISVAQHLNACVNADNTEFPPGQEIRSSESGSHASANGEKLEESRVQARYTVTAKELHSCIIASESTRSVCSILIALLVILSHINHPLLGVNIAGSKSILAAKPLYLVLLSDITVVVAHFIMRRRRRRVMINEEEVNRKVPQEELNWARAIMVLERGLVLHQTIRGLFINCSVYVVIVACGLTLAS